MIRMSLRIISLMTLSLLFLNSCSKDDKADGYGFFEADQIIVSSETSGKIIFMDIEESQSVYKGELVMVIDTTQAFLNKLQLEAKKKTIGYQANNVLANVNVLKEQLHTAEQDLARLRALNKEKAATDKQLDEARGRVNVIAKQIEQVTTQNNTVLSEELAIDAQEDIIRDQINKSIIKNPIDGTVLVKYIEKDELAIPGKALYKVANLKEMDLNVYLTLTQLARIKPGSRMKVHIDNKNKDYIYTGHVTKISDKAEFTPKVIQTKDERENQVYKVTIRVKNDGKIKIGMPGQAYFYN